MAHIRALPFLQPRLDSTETFNNEMFSLFFCMQVGLVPKSKLINLLKAALSGDARKTVITAKELIASGVEAEVIVYQLTSLIINILTITSPAHSGIDGPSKDEESLETESQFSKMHKLLNILCFSISPPTNLRGKFCRRHSIRELMPCVKDIT